MLGFKQQEVIPTFDLFMELLHPKDRPKVKQALDDQLNKNEPYQLEIRITTKKGDYKWFEAKGKINRDKDGTPVTLEGSLVSIQERKILEEQKKVNEFQFKEFIKEAPFAVALLDREMKYLAASNQWFSDYNLNGEKIVGRSHYEIFPEIQEMPGWMKVHKEVLQGETRSKEKDAFVRADGTTQYLNWKIIPWYSFKETVGGMIMYTNDVTEEVSFQQQLETMNQELESQVVERTEELRIANKELESFSYSVSHDLRAPLRAIHGFSEILKQDYEHKLDEEGKRLLHIIQDNSLKMGELIKDILDFSRLGRKSPDKETLDMNWLVHQVVEEISSDYSPEDYEINIDNLPPAKGDLSLMKQVLTNLISNAFKYSSTSDKIEIHIGHKIVNGKEVYFISDNGVGFDMKYYDKIFGVFQRLHADDEFEGTGVGLAIAKRIIEKHGGEIWANSRVGHGANFFFTLPS